MTDVSCRTRILLAAALIASCAPALKVSREEVAAGQWLVLTVSPPDAVVHVDSTVALVRGGKAQFFLPPGVHRYTVEAPFHTPVSDSLPMSGSRREEISVSLQPFYSYLTVRPGSPDAEVYLDRALVGCGPLTTGRITPGEHRLTVIWDKIFYYDADITVDASGKKVVELDRDRDGKILWQERRWGMSARMREVPADEQWKIVIAAPVTITAPSADTEILINRERVGFGSWSGTLPEGFYALGTRKDGVESATRPLWINDEAAVSVEFAAAETCYAALNVHSNVIGAEVYVNGKLMGQTPCIAGGLPADITLCKVVLKKEGYRDARKKVRKPKTGILTDVEVRMKVKK